MPHPFDRYAGFVDLPALLAATARPLRKSIRINRLKASKEQVISYAQSREWDMQPVPWCDSGWFVERPAVDSAGNARTPLGKDLLHVLGHFYMQEAASMLPVCLLQPEPGEFVLDMSAAPGSKTTHIADCLQGKGVVLANDVQEKRLWTLKAALHRSGVTGVIVTKKVGQWFGGHMTERFDRVLCDAPCTAQGTARKDSDALQYCSAENIHTMSRLQAQLLTSAIHAAKVGGTIVYSTCTLTPEENEGVVAHICASLPGIEVVDPRSLGIVPDGYWDQAIEDSLLVQKKEGISGALPLLRLWPHTYDTEGFFCAVLRKTAPTHYTEKRPAVLFQEKPLPVQRAARIRTALAERFGVEIIREDERLFERGKGALILTSAETMHTTIPVQNYALGLPAGKQLRDASVIPSHELLTLRGADATRNVVDLQEDQLQSLLQAEDLTVSSELDGHVIVRFDGNVIGVCLARDGRLKNNLPRWMLGMTMVA